jgi:hypothetical protein
MASLAVTPPHEQRADERRRRGGDRHSGQTPHERAFPRDLTATAASLNGAERIDSRGNR